jgi:hypothetical protein
VRADGRVLVGERAEPAHRPQGGRFGGMMTK